MRLPENRIFTRSPLQESGLGRFLPSCIRFCPGATPGEARWEPNRIAYLLVVEGLGFFVFVSIQIRSGTESNPQGRGREPEDKVVGVLQSCGFHTTVGRISW